LAANAAVPTDDERSSSMHIDSGRARALTGIAAVTGGLVLAQAAWAHAEISPPVAKAKTTELFTLAVPTEKEGSVTTKVELMPPSGFGIDSFAPAPGWKRT